MLAGPWWLLLTGKKSHGGCCSQVKQTWWLKKTNKVFDINTGEGLALKSLDKTPNAFVCFQTEYRGWMSANPGGGGRAGETSLNNIFNAILTKQPHRTTC